MTDGRFWMIKCPGCGKTVFRFQDEPPKQATCNCGTVIPGPAPEELRRAAEAPPPPRQETPARPSAAADGPLRQMARRWRKL